MNFYLISPPKECNGFDIQNIQKISEIINLTHLQLRPKYEDEYENIKFIKKYVNILRNFCQQKNIKLIVNDNLDIVKKLKPDGIHLGQKDYNCFEARKILGKDFEIGVSCNNSIALAINAKDNGANYVAFGPAYKSLTKKTSRKVLNFEYIKKNLYKIDLPYFIIGGINHNNILALKEMNFNNVALINSIWNYEYGPLQSAILFKKKLNQEINK